MKKWKREWKIELIEEFNPEWKDLYYEYGVKEIDVALNDYKIENDKN